MKELRHYFITGIAALLPVSLTAFLFYLITKHLGSILHPLLKRSPLLVHWPDWVSTVLGFILLLIIVVVVGAIATGVLGRLVMTWIDMFLRRLPVVREIYDAARQLTDAVFVKRSALRRTVLVEYPSRGRYAIGFVITDEPVVLPDGRKALWVYFGTTPNPIDGWRAMVPLDRMVETTMSIGEGVKLVVSGGLVKPACGVAYGPTAPSSTDRGNPSVCKPVHTNSLPPEDTNI